MDHLTEMQAFTSIVENGGFTEAARKLKISKSAISKHISALEFRLGATLLNRTTRRVSPTEIGQQYYDKVSKILEDVRFADEQVQSMQSAPKGTIKISASTDFGGNQISRAMGAFLAQYPEIRVNMELTNRFVDLTQDNIDLAIRIGKLVDSSLKARKLATARFYIVASPEYIKKFGEPRTIDELTEHRLMHYSQGSVNQVWNLTATSGEERQIRTPGNFAVNDGLSLLTAAKEGIGLTILPNFLVSPALKDGSLVQVLEQLPVLEAGIYAVYQPATYTQPKLRACIDFLATYFKDSDATDWA
ncbi:LysR family transcriptional regulator [Amylibacter ulvae]|uniref:LysR family transcriptional regulator n=1 Tax=Paramylibacter ulvae TaxID=1651968 RepID=A0ABQ3D107_9RHOB|nr:LysR family transcriptional regulator [Amylibacter ulvae]GHA48162.1 LysR family transcriptional regulator [Amylibacter ulvae]